ncbi:MAG: hypothetical protein L6290_02795 [Thermodesulfovibrionales bacterium]|nr:hypothetical protein [Thermodesulfovibrionales bacterium]
MLSVLLLGFTTFASAETIMFPYINSNPGNLSSIVSVINTQNTGICDLLAAPVGGHQLVLHYRYFTKPVTAAAIDPCTEVNFSRPTTFNDIVTFDVAGVVEGGNAMFNDATNYMGGAGAPGFDLPNQGVTTAERGYMLVTQRCEGPILNADLDVPLYIADNLDGEIMLLDIVNGAAWGYNAVISHKGLAGMGAYAFSSFAPGLIIGATTDLLPDGWAGMPPFVLQSAPPFLPPAPLPWTKLQQVAIYPPDEFTTRFFVTPLVMASPAVPGVTNDMSEVGALQQKRTRIRLIDGSGVQGITDRDENPRSGGNTVHVRCVAGINIQDLAGTLASATWFTQQGGWASVQLADPLIIDPSEAILPGIPNISYNAIVFKLEYGTPSFAGGSMINTSTLIRDSRMVP